MPNRPSSLELFPPPIDLELLLSKMKTLCSSLGACRLAVATRLWTHSSVGPPRFRLVAAVEALGHQPLRESHFPLNAFLELMQDGRLLDVSRDADSGLGRWLKQHGGKRLMGWPLPANRYPTVFFVALFFTDRDPGEIRLKVALAGMDALARALAPPAWLPWHEPLDPEPERSLPGCAEAGPGWEPGTVRERTRLRRQDSPSHRASSPVEMSQERPVSLQEAVAMLEKDMICRALLRAEGKKSEAARALCLSRQGLYNKLRRHGMMGSAAD